MANISGKGDYENNYLILFNKKNNSCIYIDNYFSINENIIAGKKDTTIETIKAGKNTLSVDFNYINQIKSEGASFLNTDDSIIHVLQNQENYTDSTIQNLIACFANNK